MPHGGACYRPLLFSEADLLFRSQPSLDGHEPREPHELPQDAVFFLPDPGQGVAPLRAVLKGDEQKTVCAELLNPMEGDVWAAYGGDDPVVGRTLRMAQSSVLRDHLDLPIACRTEEPLGLSYNVL